MSVVRSYLTFVQRKPYVVTTVYLIATIGNALSLFSPGQFPRFAPPYEFSVAISMSVVAAMLLCLLSMVRYENLHQEAAAILTAFLLILFVCVCYASLYDASGLLDSHGTNVKSGFVSLYFSVVTLTTLGSGDFVPSGNLVRAAAATEALIGYVLLALLVAKLTVVLNGVADGKY